MKFFAREDDDRIGSCSSLHGGSCCLLCQRYISRHDLTERGSAILLAACPWCGRMPVSAPAFVEGLHG